MVDEDDDNSDFDDDESESESVSLPSEPKGSEWYTKELTTTNNGIMQ